MFSWARNGPLSFIDTLSQTLQNSDENENKNTDIVPSSPRLRTPRDGPTSSFDQFKKKDLALLKLSECHEHLAAFEELSRACKADCASLTELFSMDVFEPKALQKTVGASRSTVGLMLAGNLPWPFDIVYFRHAGPDAGRILAGCEVDNLLIGGPAHDSGKLRKGDIIVAVDNEPVNCDNVRMSIFGSDTPGSSVLLTLQRDNATFSVLLVRKATKEIADRTRLFELFTAIKGKAKELNERDISDRRRLLESKNNRSPSCSPSRSPMPMRERPERTAPSPALFEVQIFAGWPQSNRFQPANLIAGHVASGVYVLRNAQKSENFLPATQ
jgi:hypothetical protein